VVVATGEERLRLLDGAEATGERLQLFRAMFDHGIAGADLIQHEIRLDWISVRLALLDQVLRRK